MSTETPEAVASSAERTPTSVATEWRSGLLSGLFFGVLSGLAAWLIIEAVVPLIKIPDEITSKMMSVPAPMVQANKLKQELFTFGTLGALAGLVLAVGEGIARKCWKTMAFGGLGAGLLGAAFGALAGYVGHVEFLQLKGADVSDIVRTFAVQCSALGIVGAGVGIALTGLLIRRPGPVFNGAIAGLLSAGLAVVAYTVVAALFFANTITDVIVPLRATERVIWVCLTLGLLGALTASIAHSATTRSK